MRVYLLSLNAKDMTDNVLINLISAVPPRSVLVLDEIDKQLDSIKHNPTVSISVAGLLSALDGPQRLADGITVMLTANRQNILDPSDQKSLLRPGRIDRVYEFN